MMITDNSNRLLSYTKLKNLLHKSETVFFLYYMSSCFPADQVE